MNSLNYKSGTLMLEGKQIELTKMETTIISFLSDNRLKTYAEIYGAMYNMKVQDVDEGIRRAIIVHKSRIVKKTGLNITSKNRFGIRLEDKICVY